MATNSENTEDDTSHPADDWSDADHEAAIEIERKCGIALVPDGVDD